jgi:hypothetical protein
MDLETISDDNWVILSVWFRFDVIKIIRNLLAVWSNFAKYIVNMCVAARGREPNRNRPFVVPSRRLRLSLSLRMSSTAPRRTPTRRCTSQVAGASRSEVMSEIIDRL